MKKGDLATWKGNIVRLTTEIENNKVYINNFIEKEIIEVNFNDLKKMKRCIGLCNKKVVNDVIYCDSCDRTF